MDNLELILLLLITLTTHLYSVVLSTGEANSKNKSETSKDVGQSKTVLDNVVSRFAEKLNCTQPNCSQCLSHWDIPEHIDNSNNDSSSALKQVSLALIYHSLNINLICTTEISGCKTTRYGCYMQEFQKFLKTHTWPDLIETLKSGLKNYECVDFSESPSISHPFLQDELEIASEQLVKKILEANCSTSSKQTGLPLINVIDLENYVVNKYGINAKIPLTKFVELLIDLRLADGPIEDDHDHDGPIHDHDGHNHDHDGPNHDHDGHNDDHDGHNHDHDGHNHDHDGHNHDHDGHNHDHVGDNEHEDHLNSTNKDKIQNSKSLKRRRRHAIRKELTTTQKSDQCYNGAFLFNLYKIDPLTGATQEHLRQLCPVLLQQITSNACVAYLEEDHNKSQTPVAEKYGYGTIAVAIISLCSLIGIFIFPYMNKTLYDTLLSAFIALGVGTLTGDAILHLIPECITSFNEEIPREIEYKIQYYGLTILAAIYILFIFESLMDMISLKYNPKISDVNNHGHSHVPDLKIVRQMMHKQSNDGMELNIVGGSTASLDQSVISIAPAKRGFCQGMTSLALVIILGDAIHNVADGLAIGAAFSSNRASGISTSIAILCHEIPHELADFAVLLSTGMSMKKAAFYNLLGACTAFIGLYIGASVGDDKEARQWIFAIAAGMFLYVSLGDLMMELIHPKNGFRWKNFLAQNIGMLIGITIMFIIARFEDELSNLIQD